MKFQYTKPEPRLRVGDLVYLGGKYHVFACKGSCHDGSCHYNIVSADTEEEVIAFAEAYMEVNAIDEPYTCVIRGLVIREMGEVVEFDGVQFKMEARQG